MRRHPALKARRISLAASVAATTGMTAALAVASRPAVVTTTSTAVAATVTPVTTVSHGS